MNSEIKYCLDANVFITAWNDSYPSDLFPETWQLLIHNKNRLIFPKTIFDEIDPYSGSDKTGLSEEKKKEKYPLRYWLEVNQFNPQKESDEINEIALQLEAKYKTKKFGKGANKNDILLIAFAKQGSHTIVTLEANQPQEPNEVSNFKIPLICRKESIKCIDFVAFLRALTSLKEPHL